MNSSVRRFRKINATLRSLFVVFLFFFSSPQISAKEHQPNIILIMADDLGFECVEANGGTSYKTPFLNKLAEEGMRFENCHSQPLCTPSRVQLMTGKYNVRNYTRFGHLERSQLTFANLLKNAGYRTAIAGKWQLGKEKDSPQHFGFDEACLWQHSLPRTDKAEHDTRYSNPVLEINGKVKNYTNGEFAPDIVSDFICNFIEENKEEAFFAYYPMILTHCPFIPTPSSNDWDPEDPGSITYKGEPRYFPDMVSYMDKMVGKIISKIDELGLGENTLILFTGDNGTDQPIVSVLNGEKYPGGKGQTMDNGTHVPLIARWKGKIEPGTECSDLIDFSDFLPTLCEVARIDDDLSAEFDGISFLPQLMGKSGNPREWIYCWYSRDGELATLKEFARNKSFKLYSTGEFYKVQDDFFEKDPLDQKNLSKQEKRAYKTLKTALSKYSFLRSGEVVKN